MNMNPIDILKSCNTGVQTLGNLETVIYLVSQIDKKEDAEEAGQGEAIVAGIATLRAWSYFAYLDTARRVVWIFHGGSLTNGFATRPEIGKITQDWPFQMRCLYYPSSILLYTQLTMI
jgi:hypothetical protein